MTHYYFTGFLLGTMLFAATASAVTPAEFSTAINIAGRQRMLSQKMAKELLLISLGNSADKNHELLKESIALFDKSLKQLMAGDASAGLPKAPTPELLSQFKKVKELWGPYRKALETEQLGEVVKQSGALLVEANKAVGIYEKAAEKAGIQSAGAVVNIAGRQRMLSQKITKEILMIIKGLNADTAKDSLHDDKALFEKSHKGLLHGDAELGLPETKSTAILSQMNKVDVTWRDFVWIVNKALNGEVLPKEDISTLAHDSILLLREMDTAVTMYAKEGS